VTHVLPKPPVKRKFLLLFFKKADPALLKNTNGDALARIAVGPNEGSR